MKEKLYRKEIWITVIFSVLLMLMGHSASIFLLFPGLQSGILWAFGLLATPAILLGVWWKEANKRALMISSIACGILFIVISPTCCLASVWARGWSRP